MSAQEIMPNKSNIDLLAVFKIMSWSSVWTSTLCSKCCDSITFKLTVLKCCQTLLHVDGSTLKLSEIGEMLLYFRSETFGYGFVTQVTVRM